MPILVSKGASLTQKTFWDKYDAASTVHIHKEFMALPSGKYQNSLQKARRGSGFETREKEAKKIDQVSTSLQRSKDSLFSIHYIEERSRLA